MVMVMVMGGHLHQGLQRYSRIRFILLLENWTKVCKHILA